MNRRIIILNEILTSVILNAVKNLTYGEEERFFSGGNVRDNGRVNCRFRMTIGEQKAASE
jgi:hypothetical protein